MAEVKDKLAEAKEKLAEEKKKRKEQVEKMRTEANRRMLEYRDKKHSRMEQLQKILDTQKAENTELRNQLVLLLNCRILLQPLTHAIRHTCYGPTRLRIPNLMTRRSLLLS